MDLTKLAAWGVAALLAIVAAMRLLGGPAAPDAVPVALEEPAAAAPVAAGAGEAPDTGVPADGAPPGTGGLHVHVAGAVRRPGVHRVAPGSRVSAAVDAAGGLARRADPAGVNLAAPLRDGQQVVVPERGRGGGATAAGAAGATGAGGTAGGTTISLSTATAEELETLDGIGPALAARIIEYRDAHGGFRTIDELQEVDGIGEKRFAALRDAVQP
ncbi:MAG: ComEA family DNA-binding protein [Thermoleophilaceae bacterium]